MLVAQNTVYPALLLVPFPTQAPERGAGQAHHLHKQERKKMDVCTPAHTGQCQYFNRFGFTSVKAHHDMFWQPLHSVNLTETDSVSVLTHVDVGYSIMRSCSFLSLSFRSHSRPCDSSWLGQYVWTSGPCENETVQPL
jgi:hypothetical protein